MVEFAYNNSYDSSIGATPYEILYGRPYRTPLSWDKLEDRVLLGPEMLQEMEEQMMVIKQRLKEAQDCQKSYADAKHLDRSYEKGNRVFIHVRPKKSPFKYGKGAKLSPRFVGPFEILERVRQVAYKLKLPSHLGKTHDVFHISILRHYIPYPSHVLKLEGLQVSKEGVIQVEPYCILDHRVR